MRRARLSGNKRKASYTSNKSVCFLIKKIHHSRVKTAANMHHTCRYCIIDNVAFAKKNTNITFEAIKNRSLTAPTIVSRTIDTEKETKNKNKTKKQKENKQISIIIKIRSHQFPKQCCTKNIRPPPPPPPPQKTLKSKYCTTWSEYSCRQTSVEKAITWQKSFEKLPSHF